MRPTANKYGKIIDCRQLILEGKFFELTRKDVLDLAVAYYRFVNNLYDNECIMAWKLNNKSINNEVVLKKYHIYENEIFNLEIVADVKSSRVYNKASLIEYEKALNCPNLFVAETHSTGGESIDYEQYVSKEIKPYLNDTEKYKKALIKLFSEEGKICKACYWGHDLYGYILSSKDPISGLYNGEIVFRGSCWSIYNELDRFADEVYLFAKELGRRYASVNIVVYVGTSTIDRSPLSILNKKVNRGIDWYIEMQARYKYENNVGWGNVVSGKTSKLIKDVSAINDDRLLVDCFDNGALAIRMNYPISQTSIKDLKILRKVLYDVLTPGGSSGSREWFMDWREKWEICPVLDDEIEVLSDIVVIRHRGKPNLEYLFPQIKKYDLVMDILRQSDPLNKVEKNDEQKEIYYQRIGELMVSCASTHKEVLKSNMEQAVLDYLVQAYGKRKTKYLMVCFDEIIENYLEANDK